MVGCDFRNRNRIAFWFPEIWEIGREDTSRLPKLLKCVYLERIWVKVAVSHMPVSELEMTIFTNFGTLPMPMPEAKSLYASRRIVEEGVANTAQPYSLLEEILIGISSSLRFISFRPLIEKLYLNIQQNYILNL